MPGCFVALRARFEADESSGGTVGYIRVLRLLESVGLDVLTVAVEEALKRESITADLVRVLVEAGRQRPAVPLSLEGRPQLQAIHVERPDLAAYRGLMHPEEGQL